MQITNDLYKFRIGLPLKFSLSPYACISRRCRSFSLYVVYLHDYIRKNVNVIFFFLIIRFLLGALFGVLFNTDSYIYTCLK